MHCFVADQQSDLVRILPDEIKVDRRYWLNTPEEIHDLARIKAVSQFLSARVDARKNELLGIK